MKNFSKLIGLLLLVCLPLLTINVHTKNARNELARLAMGTIFLFIIAIAVASTFWCHYWCPFLYVNVYVCMYIIIYVTTISLNDT